MADSAMQRDEFGEALYRGLEALPSNDRLTPEQLEVVYALAYAHVAQEQYAQALPVFAFLAQYGPTRKHYLIGLGLCLQMLGRLEEAINIFSLVLTLYPDSLPTALRIAECQLAARQFDQARRTLQLLSAADVPSQVRARAEALLQLSSREAAS
ncbi:tetratricopeptide repeat protein [Achromobacter xylosoxidans]|uniref:tetratricopeptide repeat protein n=1 Tax=Alcaligenes xylosoxydans xylosoxydans TaxID=85698 RepID=UPI0004B5CC14|nr:tetratricopeptide repeat protein [Achromobacter xylosoxidans]CUJ53996.1 Salmonella invasin chaperone [Achromobacter xylosoxidans]